MRSQPQTGRGKNDHAQVPSTNAQPDATRGCTACHGAEHNTCQGAAYRMPRPPPFGHTFQLQFKVCNNIDGLLDYHQARHWLSTARVNGNHLAELLDRSPRLYPWRAIYIDSAHRISAQHPTPHTYKHKHTHTHTHTNKSTYWCKLQELQKGLYAASFLKCSKRNMPKRNMLEPT